MSAPAVAVPRDLELRCHSCSMYLGSAPTAMRLVALFRASLFGQVRPGHTGEFRRRCRSCGWVNVFHPLTAKPSLHSLEVK